MFWGLIMEPQRRYTQVVKKPFHISMAAIDLATSSDEPAQIMCGFEGRNYLLCTLSKSVMQCPLDLNFEVGDELSLATNGKCHVHLTGYLVEETNEFLEEEEDDDDEEVKEEIEEKEVKKNKKRNKKDQNGTSPKKIKKDQQDESDEDSEVDMKALLENTLESDEDDESFNGEENEAEEAEDEEDEEEAEDEEDEEAEGESEDDEDEESSLSEEESEEESTEVSKQPKLNGNVKKQEQLTPKQKEKKNKKQQVQEKNTPAKENQSPKKDTPKKVIQGGLIIEELREGQGPPAKSGKIIGVYYEGRLKNNNKLFDSHNNGKPFEFRLGAGEVIKGWDSGFSGMKVGGKRRITCPPQMAYGAKGSPPTIPGNSTLVFEVELKKVR